MDLSVLHWVQSPERDYTWKDKLNSITGPFACRFLEWTGWYNQDIYQRLLGHYRLYQIFKARNRTEKSIHLPLAYIISYRSSHPVKYLFSYVMSIIYRLGTFGSRYHALQIEGINKWLLAEQYYVLQEFLTNAEVDFQVALHQAIQEVNGIGKNKSNNLIINQVPVFISHHHENKMYNHNTHYFNEYNTTIQSGAAVSIKGKEKGVFSKKQVLILFDLLADTGNLERIDYSKTNKFEALAEMLHAVTGKGTQSWIEQLKDYRSKGLYEYSDPGELRQLIIILTNLNEISRKAGFRKLSSICDRKLKELDTAYRHYS